MDIGFQLYSARNYPFADVLKTVAALGYTQVEGYGALYTDPADLKRQFDANGLTMPTAHISLADLEDTGKTLKLAETLGIKVVVCPWLAPELRPTTADGWKSSSGRSNPGIYKLNGDALEWCAGNPGIPRPTAFFTKPQVQFHMVLKRKN